MALQSFCLGRGCSLTALDCFVLTDQPEAEEILAGGAFSAFAVPSPAVCTVIISLFPGSFAELPVPGLEASPQRCMGS